MYVFLWSFYSVFIDIWFNKKCIHENDDFGILSILFFYYSYLW